MKKFFQKIGAFIALLLGNAKKFEAFLVNHVDEGIEMVYKLQRFIEGGTLKSIIQILPDKYEVPAEKVRARIIQLLHKVLDELGPVSGCMHYDTIEDRLCCYIAYLKTLKEKSREGEFKTFAALYAKYSSGEPLKDVVVNATVEARLMEKKFNLQLIS